MFGEALPDRVFRHRRFNIWGLLLPFVIVLLAGPVGAQQSKPFSFAVSAMTSPAHARSHYAEFRAYLEARLGRPVAMKQRRTYAEINRLLAQGAVSIAFTCTGGFLEGRRDFGLEALAVPVVQGKTTYNSYLITRKENPASELNDLKGAVFAFTDPLSLTGHIYPTAALNALGIDSRQFFKKTFFTSSHDKSIDAVCCGLADAAAVDSLIFDSLAKEDRILAKDIKVIHVSPDFGMPPIVVSPLLNVEDKRLLLKVLLGMNSDPEGRRVLKALEIERFEIPQPSLYRSAIVMEKELPE